MMIRRVRGFLVSGTGSGYNTNGIYHAFLLTPAPPPGFVLTAPKLLTNRLYELPVQGPAGQQFDLQGSTNLLDWTPLATNTPAQRLHIFAFAGFQPLYVE